MTEENTQSPEKGLEEFCEDEKSALPARTADEIAKLENDLQHERDARKEERFYWVMAIIAVMDMATFQWINWWQSTLIFLLEVAALIGLAQAWGVDLVVDLLRKLFFKLLDTKPPDAD